jgi:hypothetical protein
MSYRYGDRLLPCSQGPPNPPSPSASVTLSNRQIEDASTAQDANNLTTESTIGADGDIENSPTDAPKRALPLPSLDQMESWTLAQLKGHLEEVVMHRRIVSSQERNVLETRRLSLVERVTRLERAEAKERDAARRGEI